MDIVIKWNRHEKHNHKYACSMWNYDKNKITHLVEKNWNQGRNQNYGIYSSNEIKAERKSRVIYMDLQETTRRKSKTSLKRGLQGLPSSFSSLVSNSFLPLSPSARFCLPPRVFISNKGREKHEIVTNNNHESRWYLCSSISWKQKEEKESRSWNDWGGVPRFSQICSNGATRSDLVRFREKIELNQIDSV